MKQKGATKEAIDFIKKECLGIFDTMVLTQGQAFNLDKGKINRITISGRTLRKIFENEHIHTNTIKATIKELGGKVCMINGKIDIENEKV